MSEANSVRIALVQRTSFATPATLNLHVLPTTGQSLRNRVGYQQSQTLRTDANVQDLIRLSLSTEGALPLEMQFPVANEALWFLLRAVLRSTETAEASVGSLTTVAGTKTITRPSGSFITDGWEVGDITKNTGAASPGDNGFFKVTNVVALTLTVEKATNFVGSVGNVTTVRGARMKNGTERYFFDVEVGRLDTSLFELYRQLVVDGFTLTVSDNAITNASFNLLGITTERAGTTFSASIIQPTVGQIFDALGVPVFNFGGLAYSAKTIEFTIANNVRARTQVGTLGGTAFSWGAFEVTTRSSSYIATFTEIDNYAGNIASDMWFVMQNSTSKALSFSFPQHKWADLTTDTRGLNQDDYMDGTGQAILDPVELCTMRVQRWVA